MNKKFVNILTLTIISIYMVMPLYVLGHMVSMANHHNIFVSDTCHNNETIEEICRIDTAGYLNNWHNTFLKREYYYKNKIIENSVIVGFMLSLITYLLINIGLYKKRLIYKEIKLLYVELFSSGILNRKTYNRINFNY